MLTLVISLERRPDRRVTMVDRLTTHHLQPRFVNAVDGQALDGEGLIESICHATGMRPNEVACYMSHQRAWQAVLDSGAPCALILEDDAMLARDLPRALAALERISDKFDVVRLSALRRLAGLNVCSLPSVGRLILTQKNPSGLVGYVVSRQGAGRLLKALHDIRTPVDTAMDRYWQWGGMVLTLAPSVVLHDKTSQSDIAPGGRVCVAPPRAGLPKLRFYAGRRWSVYKTYWRCKLRAQRPG